MPRLKTAGSALICTALLTTSAQAAVTTSSDTNGLITWTLTEGALKLQLVQRLPDQTRAFFLARGFPSPVADKIADSCVFQVIGMNAAKPDQQTDVRIDLGEWRIQNGDRRSSLKLKETWAREWGDDVPAAARIAFRWATFPTDQVYHPADDHNWGMVSLGPPPGTSINLDIVWFENGRRQSQTIRAVTCPIDPEQGSTQ